jgi:AcrR family transcriptional regulator
METHSHQRGRPRDPTLEAEILTKALELVAEQGYENVSMDAVAAAAHAGRASLYRRWPSKAQMVAEAIRRSRKDIEVWDTGSIRGDLMACMREACAEMNDGAAGLIAGLTGAIRNDPDLAHELRESIVQTRREALRAWVQRCVNDGLLVAGADLDAIAEVMPATVIYRATVTGEALDEAFCRRTVDRVLMPMLTECLPAR